MAALVKAKWRGRVTYTEELTTKPLKYRHAIIYIQYSYINMASVHIDHM